MYEWQQLYEEAILETDDEKLKAKVETLEAAIFLRLQDLAKHDGDGSHNSEHLALQEAIANLRRLQTERLHFPPLS